MKGTDDTREVTRDSITQNLENNIEAVGLYFERSGELLKDFNHEKVI